MLLSAPQEKLLIEASQKDNLEAKTAIANAFHGYIQACAKKYANQGVPVQDLVQEGHLGLLRAVENFDFDKQLRLSTYAKWWIKSYQVKALENQGSGAPLNKYQKEQVNKVKSAINLFRQEFGRDPNEVELVEFLNGSIGIKAEKQLNKINEYIQIDNNSTEALNIFSFDEYLADVESEVISQALDKMPANNKEILLWRFGIGCNPHTFKECGEKLDVSPQRAEQLYKKALRYLQYSPDAADARNALQH